MRVKVHTLAPLPEVKVLILLGEKESVKDLAQRLVSSVLAPASTCSPSDLLLEVDGFQLLFDSPASVIEPSDVVT